MVRAGGWGDREGEVEREGEEREVREGDVERDGKERDGEIALVGGSEGGSRRLASRRAWVTGSIPVL